MVATDSVSIHDTLKKSLFKQTQSLGISEKKNEVLAECYTIQPLSLNASPLYGICLLLQWKNSAVLYMPKFMFTDGLFLDLILFDLLLSIFLQNFINIYFSFYVIFFTFLFFFLFIWGREHTVLVNNVCFTFSLYISQAFQEHNRSSSNQQLFLISICQFFFFDEFFLSAKLFFERVHSVLCNLSIIYIYNYNNKI